MLLLEFLGGELGVGGGVGVDDEALDIGDVGQEREDLELVDEAPCRLLSATYLEGEDGSGALGEVLLVEGMVGMALECRVVDLRHLGMVGQEIDDLERILDVTLHAQRQRLDSLQ